MKNDYSFLEAIRRTKILKPPKHAIATFGSTTMRYVLVSMVSDQPGYSRVREGEVTAQRPKILTPDFWKNRFEGFGDASKAYRQEMEKTYGEALKGLEYSFRNHLNTTSLEHSTLPEVVDRMQRTMAEEDAPRTALLEGPDMEWSLSIMKFIVEMSMRSFPVNLRELDERGLLNPEKHQEDLLAAKQSRERFEIETLFQQAQTDRSKITPLAQRLKEAGLFTDYEDRFFQLVNH